jgi:RNA-directed DNA polymerase
MAPEKQLLLPLEMGGETLVGEPVAESSVRRVKLMERILERENMLRAFRKVKSNRGSPGVDGMTVNELPEYLKEHWPQIRGELLEGKYRPAPVRRVEIPKPGGGRRKLGIPTVLDRMIQQAMLQILQREWDPTFSDSSFGFRPGRSTHQAVGRAQEYLRAGYSWVVDIDLEKFFDRVNHDKLMSLVRERIGDRRVRKLIHAYLKAGALEAGVLHETVEGTPQGGPLSPLLSNLVLDRLDKELERRGHRFARYADDSNIYVRSERAAKRVLASVTTFLSRKLKLRVNEVKSGIGRVWRRTFLGFSFTGRRPNKRRISMEVLKTFKEQIRERTFRTRGARLEGIVEELRHYILGWRAYFGYAESRSVLKELDSWIRRRLRCYQLKQWGRARYRELVKRGVSRELAWNTQKSAHGPWRLSRSPALSFALPAGFFDALGLPRLYTKD